jgi:hypothetical protein
MLCMLSQVSATSRVEFRLLSLSALENNYNMEFERPRKNKSRKLMKKQAVQELARQACRLQKATKKTNYQRELALLYATPEFKFFGELIIRSREDATNAAITYSNRSTESIGIVLRWLCLLTGHRSPERKSYSERVWSGRCL